MAHKEKTLDQGEYCVYDVPDPGDVECRCCDTFVDIDKTNICETCGERFCKECLTKNEHGEFICLFCKENKNETNVKSAVGNGSGENPASLDLHLRATECEQVESIS